VCPEEDKPEDDFDARLDQALQARDYAAMKALLDAREAAREDAVRVSDARPTQSPAADAEAVDASLPARRDHCGKRIIRIEYDWGAIFMPLDCHKVRGADACPYCAHVLREAEAKRVRDELQRHPQLYQREVSAKEARLIGKAIRRIDGEWFRAYPQPGGTVMVVASHNGRLQGAPLPTDEATLKPMVGSWLKMPARTNISGTHAKRRASATTRGTGGGNVSTREKGRVSQLTCTAQVYEGIVRRSGARVVVQADGKRIVYMTAQQRAWVAAECQRRSIEEHERGEDQAPTLPTTGQQWVPPTEGGLGWPLDGLDGHIFAKDSDAKI
jgi:hypothetical protein